MNMIERRFFLSSAAALLGAVGLTAAPWVWAEDEAPDDMIRRLSDEILAAIRSDKALQTGDLKRVMEVVDRLVMPNINFTRMTASATGPAWRQATPEQRQRLQDEFKSLLVHTYSGALEFVGDQEIDVLPVRARPDDKEVVVRTKVRHGGDPVQVDYRMERTPGDGTGWKVYDLNVMGIWLAQNYRSQFSQQINQSGIDGLIASLAERNKTNAVQN